MVILKIGMYHKNNEINCQDMASEFGKFKVVTDGCSACPHAEVGAKLFHYFIQRSIELDPEAPISDHIRSAMDNIMRNFKTTSDIIKYCLFTVMVLKETDTSYDVYNIGDGVIVLVKHNGTIEYKSTDYNNCPPYPAYEFIQPEFFMGAVPNTTPSYSVFSKEEYKMVGIASDGIKEILASLYRGEFERYLLERREGKIRQLINKMNRDLQPDKQLHDDISIAI